MERQSAGVAAEYEPLLRSNGQQIQDPEHPDEHHEEESLNELATIGDSKLKLVATGFDFWATGVAMAAIGVLIPEIEHYYGTDDATTAFMFPAGLLGYLASTMLVEPIRSRLGRRGIAVISPILRISAALVVATRPSFAILLAVNTVYGVGSGLTDITWNNWASSLSQPNLAQGLLHGSFSFGCILGPIVVVALLKLYPWNAFYFFVAALTCISLLLQSWAFRKDAPSKQSTLNITALDTSAGPSALKSRALWTCALFFFLYQGVEAVFTDWIVVYMRRVRHIDPTTAGLSSSVFWGGMALGRYSLGPVSDRFGVHITVTIYIVIAIFFQIGLGIVQNGTATLVVLGLNGFMVAPLYPSGVVVLVSRLPSRSQLTAVAVAMGLGQMGAAVAPLGVGFMATRLGMQHLIEVVCGMSILMLLVWIAFSRLI